MDAAKSHLVTQQSESFPVPYSHIVNILTVTEMQDVLAYPAQNTGQGQDQQEIFHSLPPCFYCVIYSKYSIIYGKF